MKASWVIRSPYKVEIQGKRWHCRCQNGDVKIAEFHPISLMPQRNGGEEEREKGKGKGKGNINPG